MDANAILVAGLTPDRIHARYARKIRRHVGAVLGLDQEREDLVQEVLMIRRRLLKAKARFEKLARSDRELARCIDDARASSRRWGPESPASPADAE
jgi:DNA-directed RNA polymerase specialized sigma24 family protein